MSTTCRIRIDLNVGSSDAQELCKVLAPDNVELPQGMTIQMQATGPAAIIEIDSIGGISHVIGTADEILAHAQVVLGLTGQAGA